MKNWTPKEIAIVVYMCRHQKHKIKNIAYHLGRTIGSINAKIYAYENDNLSDKLTKNVYNHISTFINGSVKFETVYENLKNPATVVPIKNEKLYVIGSHTTEGICLQKDTLSEKEVLGRLIYGNADRVIYKLVEVKVESKLVEK